MSPVGPHFTFACPHCHKTVAVSVALHGADGPTKPLSPLFDEFRRNALGAWDSLTKTKP